MIRIRKLYKDTGSSIQEYCLTTTFRWLLALGYLGLLSNEYEEVIDFPQAQVVTETTSQEFILLI